MKTICYFLGSVVCWFGNVQAEQMQVFNKEYLNNLLQKEKKLFITNRGKKDHTDFDHCDDYVLSHEDIKKILINSVEITGIKLHRDYIWLPCYITGRIDSDAGTILLTIRPIGISMITFPNEEEIFLGCETQECCNEVPIMCHQPNHFNN